MLSTHLLKLSVVWSVGPGSVSWVSWVISCWISELTIVVLGVQLTDRGLTNSDEVVNIFQVRNVGVEVILEMLKHVHVLLNISISSHSWEGESLVNELPGVDSWWFKTKLSGNCHSILIVLNVELS